MADEILKNDQNRYRVMAGVTNDSLLEVKMLRVDPTTKKLLVDTTSDCVISTLNSYNSTLTGGASFTGTSEDICHYGSIIIYVLSTQGSASNGFKVYFSDDEITWRIGYQMTIESNADRVFVLRPLGKFLQVTFTNGASSATIKLTTLKNPKEITPALPLDYPLTKSIPALTSQSLIYGQVRATVSGTPPGENSYNVLRTDSGLNLSVGTAQGGGGIEKIATDSNLWYAIPYTNLINTNLRGAIIQGIGFYPNNDITAPVQTQQDGVESFTITADGIYPIVQRMSSDFNFTNIHYINICGCNSDPDYGAKIEAYYWSENYQQYIRFFSGILKSSSVFGTPPSLNRGSINHSHDWGITPIVANWNRDDDQYGYISVSPIDSGSFVGTIGIELGHFPWIIYY